MPRGRQICGVIQGNFQVLKLILLSVSSQEDLPKLKKKKLKYPIWHQINKRGGGYTEEQEFYTNILSPHTRFMFEVSHLIQ